MALFELLSPHHLFMCCLLSSHLAASQAGKTLFRRKVEWNGARFTDGMVSSPLGSDVTQKIKSNMYHFAFSWHGETLQVTAGRAAVKLSLSSPPHGMNAIVQGNHTPLFAPVFGDDVYFVGK